MSLGEETVFDSVIRDNERDLLSYFQRRLLNSADAAEAYGELLLTAWRLHRKMPADPVEARMWFFGVAHNVLRNSRRTLARRSAAVQRLADDMRAAAPPHSDDVTTDVRGAIASLAADDAELVRLVYWEGLHSHEAAAVLGVNPSTARSRLSMAKARLRALLTADHSDADPQRSDRESTRGVSSNKGSTPA